MITNFNRKILLLLILFSISVPSLGLADSYDGPYCWEEKSSSTGDPDDPRNIRGTCKQIGIENVVSLDPSLKKDYFIGTHQAFGFGCFIAGCEEYTKYSEQLRIYSSSSLVIYPDEWSDKLNYIPTEVAVFNKSFFLPLLTKEFKKNNLNFSLSNFPVIHINIFESKELEKLQKDYPSPIIPKDIKMDSLSPNDTCDPGKEGGCYVLNTLSYAEYGKYIWGPKTEILESQYAGFYKNDKAKTEKELGISYGGGYRGKKITTVSPVNPLRSVTHYWTYAERNGKPAMVWQKTDYGFGDGTTKSDISKNDSNDKTKDKTEVEDAKNSTRPKNIFQRIWNYIVSWFK